VVDASQGVEAQTVANCYTALELGVEVVPVLNKIDLPAAEPERARSEIEDVIGIDASDAILASAKTGLGIDDILEAVVARMPPPKGDPDGPLKALIIDSWFDNYVGVVMLVRVVDGTLKPKDRILLMATGCSIRASRSACSRRSARGREQLRRARWASSSPASRSSKRPRSATRSRSPTGPRRGAARLQGDQAAGVRRPLSGRIFRVRGAARRAREAEAERRLAAVRARVSQALGFGFRCGFLGLLHMDIVQERLEREFDMDLITTAPTWCTRC
jgi:GTP-binding protein LepA